MSVDKTVEILKNAILLEKRGQAFYAKVAEQASSEAVKQFFSLMAEEELTHVSILSEQFKNLARKLKVKNAAGLLRSALRGDDPTIFFEHRALLDTAIARRPYPGDEYMIPFGEASTLADGDGLTVVTWGAMTHRVVESAQRSAGRVEILDLRTIVPWDKSRVLESVRKTGKCLIVHEDALTGGFGAEIAAVIAEEAFTDLDAPLARIAVPDVPIPYNMGLMNAVVPQVADIAEKIQSMLAF